MTLGRSGGGYQNRLFLAKLDARSTDRTILRIATVPYLSRRHILVIILLMLAFLNILRLLTQTNFKLHLFDILLCPN